MKHTYIYLLGILFLFSSCEDLLTKEIALEDVGFEPQLVLNTNVDFHNNNVRISLTKNISLSDIDDKDYALIKDADIKFKVAGTQYEVKVLPEPFNIYGYNVALPGNVDLLGKEIEISASKEGYKDILSKTTMPNDFSVVDLSYEEKAIGQDNGKQLDRIKFTIEDNVNEENFYEFQVYAVTRDTSVDINGDTTIYDNLNNLILEKEISSPVDNNAQVLYNDINFNGLKFSFSFGVNTSYLINNKPFGVVLFVRSLSKSKYLHRISVEKYRRNQNLGFFSEPVTVYTNVENGLGALTAEYSKKYTLK